MSNPSSGISSFSTEIENKPRFLFINTSHFLIGFVFSKEYLYLDEKNLELKDRPLIVANKTCLDIMKDGNGNKIKN
jgi:hypothetical protein